MYNLYAHMQESNRAQASPQLLEELPENRTMHNIVVLAQRFPELELYVSYHNDGDIVWLTIVDSASGQKVDLHGLSIEGYSLSLSRQLAEAFDDVFINWFGEGKPRNLAQQLFMTYKAIRQRELKC